MWGCFPLFFVSVGIKNLKLLCVMHEEVLLVYTQIEEHNKILNENIGIGWKKKKKNNLCGMFSIKLK